MLQVSVILFYAVAGCVTKCWFCHIRRRLARRLMANAATPPRCRRVLRAGGSLRSNSRQAVRAAQFRRTFVAPHHSARSTLPQRRRDGLTKPAFCHRSPLFFAAVAASGRSLRSLRAAARRILAALAGGVRSNRQGLRAAARTARQQVHIIV